MRGFRVVVVVALAALGCHRVPGASAELKVSSASNPPPVRDVQLRAALFPYLPDAAGDGLAALARHIETEFERENPRIDLQLRKFDKNEDFYEVPWVAGLLGAGAPATEDVAEVDSVILGDLADLGVIGEWPAQATEGWHEAAKVATSVERNGVRARFGVPHWMCTHILFSRSTAVAKSATARELIQNLRGLSTPAPNLFVDLAGSWNLPALYLDGWADTNGNTKLETAITTPLNADAVASLVQLGKECDENGTNPCVNQTFHDNDLAAERFARAESDGLLGYSERLHVVLRNQKDTSKIAMASAPLGAGSQPIVFVDSFVVRRGCDTKCRAAAESFIAFMNKPETFQWIMLSEDVKAERVPRYLLAAFPAVYDLPAIKADPYYSALNALMVGAAPFPSRGLFGNRKAMKSALVKALSEMK